VCIDQKPAHGTGLMWTHIPHGVEDETGDRPLAERARWLRHAAFFVGLSSGLSWLAWAAGCPVVMISGFTHPTNEFNTPYRVVNWHACNGCWNDPRVRFDHKDFLWCPRHAGTPRQFECTRLITATQVMQVIQRIPGFGTAAVPGPDIQLHRQQLHPVDRRRGRDLHQADLNHAGGAAPAAKSERCRRSAAGCTGRSRAPLTLPEPVDLL